MAYNVVTAVEIGRMVDLYATGMSSTDISKAVGRDGRLVRTHLKAAGVLRNRADAVRLAVDSGKIRSSDMLVREDFFHSWTPESAWVLGLLFGDGHVRNNDRTGQRQITLAGTEEVCRKVAAALGHQRGPVRHNQGANCWLLKWSSWRMVKELSERFAMSGAKATTMKFPDVPDEALPHFVRGLWDSDGGWDRRGSHVRANYACSSDVFVGSLMHVLRGRNWDPRKYEHRTVLNGKEFIGFRIELLAAHTRELAWWLYRDSLSMIRCDRKYLIAAPEEV